MKGHLSQSRVFLPAEEETENLEDSQQGEESPETIWYQIAVIFFHWEI